MSYQNKLLVQAMLPFRLAADELRSLMQEVERMGYNSLGAKYYQKWSDLAARLGIPMEQRINNSQLRSAVDLLISISCNYVDRDELAQCFEVSKLEIGMRVWKERREALIVGFVDDGRIIIEYINPPLRGKKREHIRASLVNKSRC